MINERKKAVVSVTRLLNELEASLDTSLIHGSKLTIGMLENRLNAKLAASVGQAAFQQVIDALDDLAQARAKIVLAHHALADIRSDLGLEVFAAGDLGKLLRPTAEANDDTSLALEQGDKVTLVAA
jgi:hypothetical protein